MFAANKHRVRVTALVLLAILSATACQEKPAEQHENTKAVADHSEVLVVVNGEPITQAQLDVVISSTISGPQLALAYEQIEKKVLESMIASRLMKQAVLNEMDADDQNTIRLRANAFEEELYVKHYMETHLEPVPVTAEMVREYYDKNPELFGAGEKKTFQVLKPSGVLTEENLQFLMGLTKEIQTTSDWEQLARRYANRVALNVTETKASPVVFGNEVKSVVENLGKGETSGFLFIKDVPHIFRVVAIEAIPPKALHEVSPEIRKMLAPLQVKKAVQQVSEALKSAAVIEYPEKN